jgi:tetratricopeptide (TPR) repeat protein
MAAKLYLFAMRAWPALILFFLSLDAVGQSLECLGKPHPYPVLGAETKSKLEAQLTDARKAWMRDSSQPDVIIWYGRRLAYLGHYHEAIEVYSRGLTLYPSDARFLRHRGHRWITLRCNREAIVDLTRAAELVQGKPDQIEPDGMPNALNIPTSTLQTNIWYHLGLALYLEGDFNRAAEAWKTCLKLSGNPDMYMATAYWLYISLRRAGREEEAKALLATVETGVELIENEDYYTLLLLYKGVLKEEEVLARLHPEAGTLSNATTGYALGVYYLLKGHADQAKELWKQVLGGTQWSSFGFIAAEGER